MGAPTSSNNGGAGGGGGGVSSTSQQQQQQQQAAGGSTAATHGNGTGDTFLPSTHPLQQHQQQLNAYLSLIQQYLEKFMVDNATFLAERCVADHPDSHEAAYLLALCYYRSGSVKRARQTLTNNRSMLLMMASTATAGATATTASAAKTISSMRFLTAQCAYEMKDYSRAEEALLHDCRIQYQRLRASANATTMAATATANANGIGGNDPASSGLGALATMDEWIVHTTVRTVA